MPSSVASTLELVIRQHLPRAAQVEVTQDPVRNMIRVRRTTFHQDTGERQITEYALATDLLSRTREDTLGSVAAHIAHQLSGNVREQPDQFYTLREQPSRPPSPPRPPVPTLWDHLLGP